MLNEPINLSSPEPGLFRDNPDSKENAVPNMLGNSPRDSQSYTFSSRWSSIDQNNLDIPSHWSVPWSDLMMVMMVMFAVMYVAKIPEKDSAVSFKKGAQISPLLPPQPATPRTEKSDTGSISTEEIFRLSEKLVTEANLDNIDVVLTDNQAIKVSVHGNLFFDSGMADIKPEAISFLNQLAQIIATNNYKIEVTGHTDDFPINSQIYPTNWELSASRAARVARYLIQEGKLEPGRFAVTGYSSYRPTLPNTTLLNKAKNRRVEITITRDEYKP
jgi:chemotaxis protein MotB